MWFSSSLVHVYRNMVSEVKFTFWRVLILLRMVNTVLRWCCFLLLCVISKANCSFKFWDDARRQRPRGVKCANFRATSVNTKHSASTSSANLSSDYFTKFSCRQLEHVKSWNSAVWISASLRVHTTVHERESNAKSPVKRRTTKQVSWSFQWSRTHWRSRL